MNFKRNCLNIIALLGAVFMVSSCSDPNIFVEYEPIEEVVDTHEEVVGFDSRYIKYGDYKSYPAYNGKDDKIDEIGSTYKVLTEYTGGHYMKAEGDRKILVVPVEFSDYTIAQLGVTKDEYVSNLNKAFFGSVQNNKYVSVAEYYNRSSYGKLRITGKVCDQFYTFSKTVDEINTYKTERRTVASEYDRILAWYEETYNETLGEDYKIDGFDEVPIYLVYTLPTELNTSNPKFFWAYTFSAKPLSWSSYSVMNTLAGYPDAHTFIHEVGHLFGLQDYYPTDESDVSNSVPEPAGRIDMMDCSVGDHTALSKMWLNWARPYWVTKSCEINIRALVDSGDLILINDEWNGTVFDEYYLIEFYSPTGLNYFDTNIGNNLAKLPTLPGVKIYHVDARLGYYSLDDKGNQLAFKYYCDDPYQGATDKDFPLNKGINMNIVHNNSTSTSSTGEQTKTNNYLYELQLNNNKSGHSVAGCADNINLYRTGAAFDKFKFNNNNYLANPEYVISITNMTYRDATIKIEKKA